MLSGLSMPSFVFQMLVGSALVLLGGCGEPKLPMTRNQIYQEQLKVPTLYMTESGRQFVAPGNKLGVAVDPKTKELAWAAWKCDNPKCPGKAADGKPQLFIWPNFLAYVKEDGTVGFKQPRNTEEDLKKFEKFAEPGCPACAKIRDRAKETPEERLQFQNWATSYVLPEAEKRRQELNEELKKSYEREAQRAGKSR
jgi:hypothetical protein